MKKILFILILYPYSIFSKSSPNFDIQWIKGKEYKFSITSSNVSSGKMMDHINTLNKQNMIKLKVIEVKDNIATLSLKSDTELSVNEPYRNIDNYSFGKHSHRAQPVQRIKIDQKGFSINASKIIGNFLPSLFVPNSSHTKWEIDSKKILSIFNIDILYAPEKFVCIYKGIDPKLQVAKIEIVFKNQLVQSNNVVGRGELLIDTRDHIIRKFYLNTNIIKPNNANHLKIPYRHFTLVIERIY